MSDAYSMAWLEAADDLGIRVAAPYTLEDASGSSTYVALVQDFGSATGAVIAAADQDMSSARGLGRWCSWLGPTYSRYDRAKWIELLNDWGWFGPADAAPEWFAGVQEP